MALPYSMINHPNFQKLKPVAIKMLLALFAQYNGENNGDFCASTKYLWQRGWNSNQQMKKGLDLLLEQGWIEMTRQGHLPNVCNLYAVTWRKINHCNGKLSVNATNRPSGYWKLGTAAPKLHSDHRDTVL